MAIGHIHKPQDLNKGGQPPVIYPGSIERVDFGEAAEDRFFIIAEVKRGETKVEWRKIEGARPFIDRRIVLTSSENVKENLKSALPKKKEIEGAIIRLIVEYPREYDSLIDESALRKYAENAFEFHLVKHPQYGSAYSPACRSNRQQFEPARFARSILARREDRRRRCAAKARAGNHLDG